MDGIGGQVNCRAYKICYRGCGRGVKLVPRECLIDVHVRGWKPMQNMHVHLILVAVFEPTLSILLRFSASRLICVRPAESKTLLQLFAKAIILRVKATFSIFSTKYIRNRSVYQYYGKHISIFISGQYYGRPRDQCIFNIVGQG